MEQTSLRVTVGHVGSMRSEYMKNGIPFLRSQNVRENRFDPAGLRFISSAFHARLRKSSLMPGDVLIVRSGAVGTSCVLPEHLSVANCSDVVIVQRPLVESQYIAFFMNSLANEGGARTAGGDRTNSLQHQVRWGSCHSDTTTSRTEANCS